MHRLADDVFAQHRPERGAAVTAAGEPRRPRPFQLDVQPPAGGRDLLAKQDCAAIAEDGEVAILVTRVCLSDRPAAWWQDIAGKDRGPLRTVECLRIESQRGRERPVEGDEARIGNCGWGRIRVEERRELRVGVLEVPA
jgi:hypothetical protein